MSDACDPSQMPAAEVAVWTGRFQPAHEGHFAILKHSISVLALPHAVVLTAYFGREAGSGKYADLARRAYEPSRNPLTEWERVQLMLLGLMAHRLTECATVMVAPRHDLDWGHASTFYPSRRIICLTDKDEFERAKAEVWVGRGEKVHIFKNLTPESTLTTTKIRSLVRAGADWRNYMPEASHAYFSAIHGPERVFGVGG